MASSQVNEQEGGSASSLTSLDLLEQILNLLEAALGNGGSFSNTDLITFKTHNVAQALYTQNKKVRRGIIQNVSSTDIITLYIVSNGNGTVANISNYKGIILNPAATANQGGESYPFGNIDLSNITVINDTTDTLVGLSVSYEY